MQATISLTSARRRIFLFTYLFLYELFNDAVNISDNTTPNIKTTKLWIETDAEGSGRGLISPKFAYRN
jgi:hypothetical protein